MRCFPLLLSAFAALALAQTAQGDVAVTIYNNDLALVQDVRRLAIPQGRSRQEFPDVSARIRPETVSIVAPDAGVIEQNFDYDLLSPAKLMEKAVGQTVTIVRTNPATGAETREAAKVLAVNGGVVLQIGDRIEVLRDDGLPVRVVFDKVPPNLRARPTLSVVLDSDRAGPRPVSLSYLTNGLGWKADYVALFDEKAGKIDVQGWITLTNSTGTTFDNANTLLVAGSVGDDQDQRYRPYPPPPPPPPDRSRMRPGTETANREQLGGFYLYPLKERTTIANAQTKQVSFLDVAGAPASKGYEYRNDWLHSTNEAESASTILKFSTSREGGLGDALPAGTVRVYMRDARGQPQFIGENAIGHTPMGSSLGLKTGEAFDVKVKPVVEKRQKITSDEYRTTMRYRWTEAGKAPVEVELAEADPYWRTTMRYTLTNARPQPVTVELVQGGLRNYWGDTRVISESLNSERRSLDEVVWQVPVPANGSVEVTATFDSRY